jgi:serine carboxypeptidase-like clade I
MTVYMNRPDVRKALNVDKIISKFDKASYFEWPTPSQGFAYKSQYAACNTQYAKGTPSMVNFYREIAPKLPHGATVYNGDTDPCVSYEGTREAMIKVGFNEQEGGAYRPWFYDHPATTWDVC